LEKEPKFLGIVKTATRRCPREILSQFVVSSRFKHKTLVRKGDDGEITMAAIMFVD